MKPIKTKIPITIYLLHFDRDISGALHYIGSCVSVRLKDRMREHQIGLGASLTHEAHLRGIGFTLVRTWQVPDRSYERTLKRSGHYKRHCPYCTKARQVDAPLLACSHFEPVEPVREVPIGFAPPKVTPISFGS